MWMALLKP